MKVWKAIQIMFNDFISLCYPHTCLVCNKNLFRNEYHICTPCLYKIPKTTCFKEKDNKVSSLFLGRVVLQNAAALYEFNKTGSLQKIISHLKYKGNTDVGVLLGKQVGLALKESNYFTNIDLIIPIPLHPLKEKKRGYNQSYFIAKGIEKVLHIPINTKSLIRVENTDSQTRKKRYNRWENMRNSFAVLNNKVLRNKHLLLIDDVLTTGATLEACTIKLLEIEGVKVSIATIAVA